MDVAAVLSRPVLHVLCLAFFLGTLHLALRMYREYHRACAGPLLVISILEVAFYVVLMGRLILYHGDPPVSGLMVWWANVRDLALAVGLFAMLWLWMRYRG